MTGIVHGAATRFHVPRAEFCLQLINQQGQLPGHYPSNPLFPPAMLPHFAPHFILHSLLLFFLMSLTMGGVCNVGM